MTFKLICVVIILFFLGKSSELEPTHPASSSLNSGGDQKLNHPKWITQVISMALLDFVPMGTYSCTSQGRLYLDNVNNQTLWAVQMLDASSIGACGLLSGNNYHFGNFDQCVSVHVPEYNISGRYMMVRLDFWPYFDVYPTFNKNISKVYVQPKLTSSVWEALKTTEDPRIKNKNYISWAMCVPSSCTPDDIIFSLERILKPSLALQSLQGNVSVLHKYNYSRIDKQSYSIGFYILMCVTLALGILVVVATIKGLMEQRSPTYFKRRPLNSLIEHFSIVKNLKKLLKPQSEEFAVMSGMKVVSMVFIIYGHRMMMALFSPMFNSLENETMIGEFVNTYFYNGILIVNTFLVITGFLTFYKILKDIERNGNFSIVQYIYHRWIRLTPTYAYVLALTVYVLPIIEGGPMNRNVIWDSTTCYNYWWTHLLYINNYVYPKHQCLIPSWYMAADMQLYVLSSLLGFCMSKSKTIGTILLISAVITFVIIPGLVVINGNFSGITLLYMKDFDFYFHQKEFIETYLQTHTRASPYLIGMLGAYIYYRLKKRNVKFSQTAMWMVTLWSAVMMLSSIGVAWFFYLPGREYSTLEHVLYAIFHKVGWAVPICWIIICQGISGFGIFRYTVGLKLFQPLNPLIYCILLVHTPLQLYLIGSLRAPPYYNQLFSLWMGAADCVFSYAVGLLLYVLVEAPLAELQKCDVYYWFKRKKELEKKRLKLLGKNN